MSEALFTQTEGAGAELLLLHGWGVHGGVWDSIVPDLTEHFRVTRVDMPGHGRSRALPLSPRLEEAARAVSAAAPPDAVWLGWSLGGLLALRAALDAPARIRGLVLVDSTARFVSGADWPHAMPPQQLADFAAGLEQDYRGTLLRFLSLQVRGDEAARETLRVLRQALFSRGEPDAASLAAGLEILRDSDLRSALARIRLPTLVMAGSHDRLTPPRASESLARNIPGARFHLLSGAGHASFISHPQEFLQALVEFMHGLAVPVKRKAL